MKLSTTLSPVALPFARNTCAWPPKPMSVVIGNERPSSSAPSAPSSGAILRRWTSRTSESQLPKYLEHFSKNVLPELRRVPGYLGATVSTRRLQDEVEIAVETTWRSLESIRGFAGSDLQAAVVPDEAAALLISFDRRVFHSEIALTD